MGNSFTIIGVEKDSRPFWNDVKVTDAQREAIRAKLRYVASTKPLNSDGTLDIVWMDFGDKSPLVKYNSQDAAFQELRKIVQEELMKRFEYSFVLVDSLRNGRDLAWWTMYPVQNGKH